MLRLLQLPALLVALGLAACDSPAMLNAPVSQPGQAVADPRLPGTWGMVGGEEGNWNSASLIVVPGEDGFLDVAYSLTAIDPKSEVDIIFVWYAWRVHASELAGDIYYNGRLIDFGILSKNNLGEAARMSEMDPEFVKLTPLFNVARIEFTGDDLLTLYFLDHNALARVSQSRQDLACGTDCELPVFDVAPNELVRLIEADGEGDLFEFHATFSRIEGSSPPQAEN